MEEAIRRIIEAKSNNSFLLSLSNLHLKTLPTEIAELDHLQELDLSYNSLSYLPEEISKLINLKFLNLSNNCFNYNYNIGFNFPGFLPIITLDLSCNNLDQIPDDIFSLTSLEELHLDENPLLTSLPDFVIESGFSAIYDYIEAINESAKIYRLLEAKLIFVGQGGVGKTSLMKKLINPNIKINVGEEPTTHGINILKWKFPIYFSHNELNHIFERYKYGYEDNYDDFYEDEDENYEYEEDEQIISQISGNSINKIGELDFVYDEIYGNEAYSNYKVVDLNVWDFGGQEIYYSTHQFFLSKRSVYVFVWDTRREEDYKGFEYWFNTINTLSEKSPIVIVMNKSDERIKQIDEGKLKKKYSNIVGFCETSCATGEGITSLRNILAGAIKSLPQIGNKLPIAWQGIRKDLARLNENYISYEKYLKICKSRKIYDKSKANFLSEYSHDLGDILHFQSDEILKQIVILNPEWVTNAFYNIIDNNDVIRNNGRFLFSDLQNIWNKTNYPVEKHYELIKLIEKFELCFSIDGYKEYIVPELVSSEQNYSISYTSEQSDLKFEYAFNFMPSGLITRFICRNFINIEKNIFWRNGLVMKFDESLALIINDVIDKKIIISVKGDDKSDLLSIIRNEFTQIFNSLKLTVENDFLEMIPCNCGVCSKSDTPHFHNFNSLKKLRNNSVLQVPCLVSYKNVEISSIIKGFSKITQNERLLEQILKACMQLQGIHKIISSMEDGRNTFIAAYLTASGVNAKDQSKWGASATNKSQGEIDIRIEDSHGFPSGIFEGLNLSNIDTEKIRNHLKKIFNYDPNGLDNNYMIVYSDSADFITLWSKYQKIAISTIYKYNLLSEFIDVTHYYNCGNQIKIGRLYFDINGNKSAVNHIFVNMNI